MGLMFGPCLTPYQPKAGLEYKAISLIHWRIIIHRAGIHLKGKKLLHNHFHFFTTEAHPLKRSEKDEPTSSRTPPDDFPFRKTPPRILTPIFQPSWRIITGIVGCHFEPGSGSCF